MFRINSPLLAIAAGALALALAQDAALAQDTGRASYDLTFESTWSAATHPSAFPTGGHYSPLIGAVHGQAITFWEAGGIASSGIERVAELGSRTVLRDDINAEIAAGHALSVIQGPSLGSPSIVTIEIELTPEFPLVTLVTMLAPSPDWFVGVQDVSLLEDGLWIDQLTLPLLAWDAGSDSGTDFNSANQNTNPKEPIALITNGPFLSTTPLGTITLTRRHSTVVYGGSGLNPAGSLLVAGEPKLGDAITVFLDDPMSVMPLPAQSFIAVSSVLPGTYPIGRTLPGFGLSGPSSNGELLVGSPLRRSFGANFNGAPVSYNIVIPNVPALAGTKLYAQGVFVAPGRIGVTEAVEIGIGL